MGHDYQQKKKNIWEFIRDFHNDIPKKVKVPAYIVLVFVLFGAGFSIFRSCNSKVEDKSITVSINNQILQPNIEYTYEFGEYKIDVWANPSDECIEILERTYSDNNVIERKYDGSYVGFTINDEHELSLSDRYKRVVHTLELDALYSDGYYMGNQKEVSYPCRYVIKILPPVVENKKLTVTDQDSLREINPSTQTPIKAGSKLFFAASPSDAVEAIYYWYSDSEEPMIINEGSTIQFAYDRLEPGATFKIFVNVLYKDGLFLDGNTDVNSGYLTYELLVIE